MVCVLFDNWLYLDIEGRFETCGREEATRHYKSRMKTVRAAFIDCEVKRVTQTLVGPAFTSDHMTQNERIGTDAYQVIGALKGDIERAHHYFKPVPVDSLVPYPAAIRAFLNGRGLLSADKAVIFLDDLKTQAVLTIIEGMRFSAPRRISMRDTAYMASEIQRNQKNYISQKEEGAAPRDISFICVSNNHEWLAALCEQGVFDKKDIVHVDHPCPALEGLKNAKFTLNFVLPEDILKQQRNKALAGYLKTIALSAGMVALGGGFWIWAASRQHGIVTRLNDLRQESQRIAGELSVIDQKKIAGFLRQNNTVDHARLYHDFISGVPRDHLIKEFSFHLSFPNASVGNPERAISGSPTKALGGDSAQWSFTAVVYPEENNAIEQKFERFGSFQNAVIEPVIVQGRLGQKIVLTEGGRRQ